ncbi:MAG: hypothetical protein D084_Lepto4C00331G0007, partial [Leptospirillum sp. Group IV 'UBA BS']
DFADQHPEFQEDFRDEIARAMETARTLPLIRNQYDSFVSDMVYVRDENVPTFAQAIEHFSEALEIVMSVRADYNLPESSWGPSD